MPGRAGGGGSHGGGFSGGGMRSGGGGFSGGGMRGGGGPAFRSSTLFSTPFPRTGGQRTTTHGPSGPYFHTPIAHPSPHYYPHHSHSLWGSFGYGYGPRSYRSGGCAGCCVCVVFLIIFASTFAYSGIFDEWSWGSNVNYDNYETLYYNDCWYESQYLTSGSQITFSMSSYSAPVTFLLSDKPLSSLPTTTKTGVTGSGFTLNAKVGTNEYFEYHMIYLKAGSSFSYDFDSSNKVDFFITDSDNFNNWYDGYSYWFYETRTGVTTDVTGSYSVSTSQDYYLVWDNNYPTTAQVNYSISFSAANVYDYSSTLYSAEAATNIATTTKTVPSDGYWYFYIYFDPMYSPDYSTTVYYDVSFTPSSAVVSPLNWTYVIPIILVIGVIIAGLAIGISRSKAKVRAQASTRSAPVVTPQPSPVSTVSPPSTPVFPPESSNISNRPGEIGTPVTFSTTQEIPLSRCFTCGAEISPDVVFCTSCGRKQQGRQIGISGMMTPAAARNCKGCGSEIEAGTRFCPYCGTPIE